MKFEIDVSQFRRSIRDNNKRFRAVSRTLDKSGEGEVIVSRRKKGPREKATGGRALHGRAIANMLAQQGRDVFAYDSKDENEAIDYMRNGIEELVERASKTSRPQHHRLKKVVLHAAEILVDAAQGYIKHRKLKRNADSTIKVKRWMVKQGLIPSTFGDPPPAGYASGQFYDGIRARWRQGRSRSTS